MAIRIRQWLLSTHLRIKHILGDSAPGLGLLLAKGAGMVTVMAKHPSDTQELLPLLEQDIADSLDSRSAAMLRCLQLAEAVAPASVPVMISGEAGAGKSLLARFIHSKSPRRKKKCVNLRCDSLGASELKSRLLGGTVGAAANRPGGFLAGADGGTLVLDGVDAMPGQGQRELLNMVRGNAGDPMKNVRLLSTVGPGLDSGLTFTEELAYILAESILRVPPLRERREDIEKLAAKALKTANRTLGKNAGKFSQGATDFLMRYDYPGNVRELFVIVSQAVRHSRGDTLFVEDFGPVTEDGQDALAGGAGNAPPLSLAEAERRHINMVLLRTGWRKSAAARALQISETMLNRKMKLYGLEHEQ